MRNVTVLALILCTAAAAAGRARQIQDADVEAVRTIDVVASRFQFEPATISVTQGERVRLRLRSSDSTHSLGLKAFRVKALIPKAGAPVTVEFLADQAGTFHFTCTEYCGSGHSRMKGSLVVLARSR